VPGCENLAHCENRGTGPLTAFKLLDTFRFVGSGSSSESLDPALSPGRSSDSSGLIFLWAYSSIDQGGSMGLLDKLLGRGSTTTAAEPAVTAPTDSATSPTGVEEREEDTSPHHQGEEEAGS
jgi:hypothetical protein